MLKQTILVSDSAGNHTGDYIDKEVAHTGRGIKHLAITVVIQNNKGQILLQHRKHKVHSDIWDLTGSTHHLHLANGKDETTEEATYRCLRREYGILQKIPLKIVGAVNYFAADGKNCENEHDIIVLGEYSGALKPNKKVSHEYKWVKKEEFFKDILENPKKYAPWAVLGAKLLVSNNKEFDDLSKLFLRYFEPYSSQYFKRKLKVLNAYPRLIQEFYSDLEDFSRGGKRMRAFLVYLGYLIGGGFSFAKASEGKKSLLKILPISLAVELIHTFLLIHDDIIDKSDTRRGKLTIHKRYERIFDKHYGMSQAIIAGDIAGFEALDLVDNSNFDSEKKILCLSQLNKVILETAYGEALDVENSHKNVNLADIENVTDLKTARYSFVGPMRVGALLAGASRSQLNAIGKFGVKIGFAFQLVDDLLGVFGDEKILGKSVLSDMREGKNTLLIYKAKLQATPAQRKILNKIWGSEGATRGDLEKVKKILKNCGAYDWCLAEMHKYKTDAVKNISRITYDPKLKNVLLEMCDFIVTRSS